jgi:hypothetical protein
MHPNFKGQSYKDFFCALEGNLRFVFITNKYKINNPTINNKMFGMKEYEVKYLIVQATETLHNRIREI